MGNNSKFKVEELRMVKTNPKKQRFFHNSRMNIERQRRKVKRGRGGRRST